VEIGIILYHRVMNEVVEVAGKGQLVAGAGERRKLAYNKRVIE